MFEIEADIYKYRLMQIFNKIVHDNKCGGFCYELIDFQRILQQKGLNPEVTSATIYSPRWRLVSLNGSHASTRCFYK